MSGAWASGERAVLVSGHPLATAAGLDVIREGGNAVDGALCAALVLQVVAPHACTLAGDAFMLVGDPGGTIHGLNGTGAAPRAAAIAPGEPLPRRGARAATVPGVLAAIADAAERFGTVALERLIGPAIDLAERGFDVHPYLARNIVERAELLGQNPAAATMFVPGGVPLAAGSRLRQPELAGVLRDLRDRGIDDFYRGRIGQRFAAAVAAAGGWLDADDLADHRSLWQRPVSAPFHGHEIMTMPPNSYGPTLLLQLLALERGGIDAVDPDSAEFVARGLRARQAAYGLLADAIGDPRECEPIARDRLDYAAHGGEGRQSGFTEATDRCTTNVVAMDRKGWSVSLIESISTPFGSGVMLDGLGIVLNNRLAGFSADPESRNALGPGRRPAHTLAPCLVVRDGKPVASIGTPGTVGQTCVLAQLLARTLACGQDEAEAIAAPRWSVDIDGTPIVEEGMDPALVDALAVSGISTRTRLQGFVSFGSIKLVRAGNNGFEGRADHRRSAAAGAV